mgnify:CR=1 FL=1
MLASARRRAWRMAGVCGLAPVYGRNVGRAISPAAGAWHHRRVSGTMRASSPTGAGQGPAGPCRIFLPLTGNAPLRLRLAAHPPPLAGEALGGLPPIKPPLQGEVSPQATEGCGTLPCEYPSGLAPGPPAGLADGWRLCVAARSRPQCRAGDFARRGGLAPPQGFRDDASIVPYGGRARACRALQDIFAANRQCTPPSAPCGASTSPCRGGFGGTAARKAPL